MRRAHRRIALGLAAVAALALACNALTGVDELRVAACEGESCPDDPARPVGDAQSAPSGCACAPASPEGWVGPMAVVDGVPGAPPACSADLVLALEAGVPSTADAGCAPCTCGTPSVTCGVTARYFDNPTCTVTTTASVCDVVTLSGTTCALVSSCLSGGGVRVSTNLIDGGCAADGGAPAPVAWDRAIVGCAFGTPPSASCSPGETCAPRAPGSRTCVAREGDEPCPAGPYTSRTLLYEEVEDTRKCTACTCALAATACSSIAVTSYAATTCSGGSGVVNAGSCTPVVTGTDIDSARITTGPDAGTCQPGGGLVHDGGVKPSRPTTVCCLP